MRTCGSKNNNSGPGTSAGRLANRVTATGKVTCARMRMGVHTGVPELRCEGLPNAMSWIRAGGVGNKFLHKRKGACGCQSRSKAQSMAQDGGSSLHSSMAERVCLQARTAQPGPPRWVWVCRLWTANMQFTEQQRSESLAIQPFKQPSTIHSVTHAH